MAISARCDLHALDDCSPGLDHKAGQGFNFAVLPRHIIEHTQSRAELLDLAFHHAISLGLRLGKYKVRVRRQAFGRSLDAA